MRVLVRLLSLPLFLFTAAGDSTAQGAGVPSSNYCIGAGPGSCYCDCDIASTAPCGNTGDPNRGCANGSFGGGAYLDATGQTSPDTVVLVGGMCTPGEMSVFFQGSTMVNGGNGLPFGDGLRCAGGDVVRLEFARADPSGTVLSTVRLSVAGGALPGQLLFYQLLYRDPLLSPCGLRFNSTNGYKIPW